MLQSYDGWAEFIAMLLCDTLWTISTVTLVTQLDNVACGRSVCG